jgi:Transposase zinc-binding domain
MSRPAVEVADLLHKQGDRFIDQSPWLSFQQLSVLRAIARCRTAALGGHIDQCSQCGHQAISYNSCLMGSNSLWGVGRQKGMLRAASRPFDSPLRLAL